MSCKDLGISTLIVGSGTGSGYVIYDSIVPENAGWNILNLVFSQDKWWGRSYHNYLWHELNDREEVNQDRIRELSFSKDIMDEKGGASKVMSHCRNVNPDSRWCFTYTTVGDSLSVSMDPMNSGKWLIKYTTLGSSKEDKGVFEQIKRIKRSSSSSSYVSQMKEAYHKWCLMIYHSESTSESVDRFRGHCE